MDLSQPSFTTAREAEVGMTDATKTNTYVVWFRHFLYDFRIPEILSVAKALNVDLKITSDERIPQFGDDCPLCVVTCPNDEQMTAIASRCILVIRVIELYDVGKTVNDVPKASIREDIVKHVQNPKDFTYRYDVTTFRRKMPQEERIQWMTLAGDALQLLPEDATVKLHDPEIAISLIALHEKGSAKVPGKMMWTGCGRKICDGFTDSSMYSLKTREYLGQTPMNHELGLIMANMAMAKPGTIVYDPFVGTGSLLISCAHYGALVTGADIDPRTYKGRTLFAETWARSGGALANGRVKERDMAGITKADDRAVNLFTNFQAYGLSNRLIGIMGMDLAHDMFPSHANGVFDAMITDPPYGIRAGALKVGDRSKLKLKGEGKSKEKDDSESDGEGEGEVRGRDSYIPQHVPYPVADLLKDLLVQAARLLVVGGRLVYWIPTIRREYSDDELPTHPCFKLISNCEQVITQEFSRRLVTVEKTIEFDESLHPSIPTSFRKFDGAPAVKDHDFRRRLIKVDARKKKHTAQPQP